MRAFIYHIKSLIDGSPRLYALIYSLFTFNFDYFSQWRQKGRFPSRFGGMWTDMDSDEDFQRTLKKKLATGEIEEDDLKLLKLWRKQGYVTIEGAIDHKDIDAYLLDIQYLMHQKPSPLLITSASLQQPVQCTGDNVKAIPSARVVDDYFFSKRSRNLLFHPTIQNFMRTVLQQDIVLTQSLRFNYGSEQPLHQDTAFVRMNAPMKLTAVWIALEDIEPGTGELLYLPGSHTWEGYLFSGRFKHYDKDRDGPAQLEAWHQWILDEAKARNVTAQSFAAKKGDLLIWHAGLAHGGAAITKHEKTRLSLVGHYCPKTVRPLYHYYKPAQRKVYQDNENTYSSSYYQ